MRTTFAKIISPMSLKRVILEQKDALLCIIDQGIVSVASFVTSVLIGRNAPEELGVYFIVLSIVYFIRGVQQQMILTPYTIFHHQYQNGGLDSYRGSCLTQQFGLTTLASLLLVGTAITASLGLLESPIVFPLIVLLFLLPALLMREVVRQYCFAHQENVSVLVIDSAISALQIGCIVVLGYFGFLSGVSAWAVIGLASLVTLTLWYISNGPKISFERSRLGTDWNQNWGFGKWAVGGQVLGSLPTYCIPWLLATAAGIEGTGFFAAVVTLVGVANIFNAGMANFLTPRAAKVYAEEGTLGLRRVVIRASLVFLVAVGVFCTLLALYGEQIAVELFGDRYAGLQTAITIIAIATLCDSFDIVASSGLFVLEKIKANFWLDVVLMIVSVSAAVLLILPFGFVGAVWTSLIISLTSALLRFILLTVYLRK